MTLAIPDPRVRWRLRAGARRARAAHMGALENAEQLALVEQLREEAASLDDSASGSASWDVTRQRLRDHIRRDDPRQFLQWPEIRSSMFLSDSTYAESELHALRGSDEWQSRWTHALVEDASGCPTMAEFYPTSSEHLIHHTYHVMTAERHLGPISDFAEVVEFGGGYGSFARLLRLLGVSARYHINDFAEFIALQRYYLASVALARNMPEVAENLTWGSSATELPPKTARRLFVALWSLSETPLQTRVPWVDVISRCDGVVIAFQSEFEGVDNKSWFGALQEQVALKWACWEHPYLTDNFYLVGTHAPDGASSPPDQPPPASAV